MKKRITLLVADDHPVCRHGITKLLSDQLSNEVELLQAQNGAEAIQKVAEHRDLLCFYWT